MISSQEPPEGDVRLNLPNAIANPRKLTIMVTAVRDARVEAHWA